MEDCIFCKVINGDFNTEFIHEDDICVVFKDINPKAKIHLLIVPKHHIAKVSDITESEKEDMGHLLVIAAKVAREMEIKGYKLVFNVGKSGGQEVFHIHLHLMSA